MLPLLIFTYPEFNAQISRFSKHKISREIPSTKFETCHVHKNTKITTLWPKERCYIIPKDSFPYTRMRTRKVGGGNAQFRVRIGLSSKFIIYVIGI